MNLFRWLKEKTSAVEAGTVKGERVKPRSDEADADVDPYDPFPEPVEIPLTDVLDLHTIPPRDVKAVVGSYLEQACAAGFPVVRIIHGKGIGVQREMVRSILARTNFVSDWGDAPPGAGGLGATIVRFRTTNAAD